MYYFYRSPLQLWSGLKGNPVALSASDKRGVQRSVPASSASSPISKVTMSDVKIFDILLSRVPLNQTCPVKAY